MILFVYETFFSCSHLFELRVYRDNLADENGPKRISKYIFDWNPFE